MPASTVDVLLVHCDPDFVSSVADVLRKHAFTVLAAATSDEVTTVVAQGCTPRTVLLDVTHRALESRRLVRTLRGEPSCAETRFLVLARASGNPPLGDVAVDGALFKPLDVRELVEVLRAQPRQA